MNNSVYHEKWQRICKIELTQFNTNENYCLNDQKIKEIILKFYHNNYKDFNIDLMIVRDLSNPLSKFFIRKNSISIIYIMDVGTLSDFPIIVILNPYTLNEVYYRSKNGLIQMKNSKTLNLKEIFINQALIDLKNKESNE